LGKYKHGTPDAEIEFKDFKDKITKSAISWRKKAYLIVLYWLGCRRSEPLVIMKDDIGKGGLTGGPIELPLTHFGVALIKKAWQKTKKGKRVFPFSDSTGYRAMKKLWPKKTPHWLRYKRITELRKRIGKETDGLTIDAIKSFTGIRRDTTIQNYGLKTKADIHKIAALLQ